MSRVNVKGRKTRMFVFLCIAVFIAVFTASVLIKVSCRSPEFKKYSVEWSDKIGTAYTDISYGEKAANKFDLYVPADNTKDARIIWV